MPSSTGSWSALRWPSGAGSRTTAVLACYGRNRIVGASKATLADALAKIARPAFAAGGRERGRDQHGRRWLPHRTEERRPNLRSISINCAQLSRRPAAPSHSNVFLLRRRRHLRLLQANTKVAA